MTVEVVTVWAPRESHEKWRVDYLDLIRLQKRSAERFGHKHTVVTDAEIDKEFGGLITLLPDELMPAMIAGVIARLRWGGDSDLVFLDADCLVVRNLDPVFERREFDLGLTRRISLAAPINNGAMYVDGHSIPQALRFFERALAFCGNHWGADQEAISQAAAPVPFNECVQERFGVTISFLPMNLYSAVPKTKLMQHKRAFVVHFKGETKDWAQAYFDRFIAPGE